MHIEDVQVLRKQERKIKEKKIKKKNNNRGSGISRLSNNRVGRRTMHELWIKTLNSKIWTWTWIWTTTWASIFVSLQIGGNHAIHTITPMVLSLLFRC